MENLNREVRPMVAAFPDLDTFRLINTPFWFIDADMQLKDGQIIELRPSLTVVALATPGHTRDHLNYYIPENKILLAAKACVCIDVGGTVLVQFLADYDLYLSSLKKLAAIPIEIMCQGHHLIFVGRNEIDAFFDRSIKATIHFRNRIHELPVQCPVAS
jgi:glyoxylase-like metal-dependent hydrolase (beta-lactamase superfamily II)